MHEINFIAHGIAMRNDAARPSGNTMPFGRQATVTLSAATQKNRNAKFIFQLLDAAGKAGLSDMTALRRAAEMLLFSHCKQIFELP